MNGEESEEMVARLLFFDILTAGEISNVLRFLSDSPRAEKWVNYIELADLIRMYGLPERVAESFCALVVWCNLHEEAQKQVEFISAKFPNIRKLVLWVGRDATRIWINKLGGNIEALHSYAFSVDIAEYCPNLRHLYLFDMDEDLAGAKFWETVGERLETLEVYHPMDTTNVIEFVEKFCRKIKRLKLSGRNVTVREAISKCIASYGNQIEQVYLHFLTENQLLRVKNACPKARIELVTTDFLLAQTVRIVGGELEETTVYKQAFRNNCKRNWRIGRI